MIYCRILCRIGMLFWHKIKGLLYFVAFSVLIMMIVKMSLRDFQAVCTH